MKRLWTNNVFNAVVLMDVHKARIILQSLYFINQFKY